MRGVVPAAGLVTALLAAALAPTLGPAQAGEPRLPRGPRDPAPAAAPSALAAGATLPPPPRPAQEASCARVGTGIPRRCDTWTRYVSSGGEDLATSQAFGPEGETVYVAGEFGGAPGVTALDDETGRTRWIRQLGGGIGGVLVAPGANGDRIYVAGVAPDPSDGGLVVANDIVVRALDADDGARLWRTRLDAGDADLGDIVHDRRRGQVLVVGTASGDPFFVGLEPANGTRNWTSRVSTRGEATLPWVGLAEASGHLVASGWTVDGGTPMDPEADRLAVSVRADGSLAWTRIPQPERDSIFTALALDPALGRAYAVGTRGGQEKATIVEAMDIATGNVIWNRTLGPDRPGGEEAWSADVDPASGRLAVASLGSTVSPEGELVVRSLAPGGEVAWVHESEDPALEYADPVEVEAGPEGDCVHVVSPSSPTGWVDPGDSNYEVRTLDAGDGALVDRVQVPGPRTTVADDIYRFAVDGQDDRLLVVGSARGQDVRSRAPVLPGGDDDGEGRDWLVSALADPCG